MPVDTTTGRHVGAQLMSLAGAVFVGYGLLSLVRTINGVRWEIGVAPLADETGPDPAVVAYVDHLQLALDGFMLATGVAVVGLSWYGVRRGYPWAWATAVAVGAVALLVSVPAHYGASFGYDHLVHLGPMYLAAAALVAGAAVSGRALHLQARTPADDHVEK